MKMWRYSIIASIVALITLFLLFYEQKEWFLKNGNSNLVDEFESPLTEHEPPASTPNSQPNIEIAMLAAKKLLWQYRDDSESEEHMDATMNALDRLRKLQGSELHNGLAYVTSDMSSLASAICDNYDKFQSANSITIIDGVAVSSEPIWANFTMTASTDPNALKAREDYWVRRRDAASRRIWVNRAIMDHRFLLSTMKSVLDEMVLVGSVTKDGAETIIRQVKLPQGKWHEIVGPGGNDPLID